MWFAIFVTVIASAAAFDVTVTNHWNGGFQGKFTITPDHSLHGWRAHIICDRALDSLEIRKATVVETKDGSKKFVVENVSQDADISQSNSLEI